jgi:hypothetical protein
MLDKLDINIPVTQHMVSTLSSCRHLTRLRLNGALPIPIAPSIKMVCDTLELLNLRSVKVMNLLLSCISTTHTRLCCDNRLPSLI